MQHATLLAENKSFVQSFDTQGTAAGAGAAAARALKMRPALILGPLSAEELPSVTHVVAGRVPLIAFSNNAVLRAPNSWIFGITAQQVTSAIMRYARSRGVRSLVMLDDGSPWSAAAAVTLGRMESELGMQVQTLSVQAAQAGTVSGEMPDAVLLPSSGDAMLRAAEAYKQAGAQLLCTHQGLDYRPQALRALDSAWIASPDPKTFGTFAREFEARHGEGAGMITALAYDAAGIANGLRNAGTLGVAGLLDGKGFHGVMGPVRFRTDGSVARDFAILLANAHGYEPVAVSSGS